MALALLLPLLLAQQDLSAPITYSTVAKPVSRALKEISDLSKLHFDADQDASREVVLISVHDVPLKDLLDRIATVTSCTWRQVENGYRLEPSVGVRNKEEQDDLAARTAAMAHSLAEEVKGLEAKKAKPGEKEADEEEASNPFGMGGTNKAVILILQAIGPAALANVTADQRLVFASNNATSMQSGMPDGCTSIITDWITEHNAQVSKAPPSAEETEEMPLPKEFLEAMKRMQKPVTEPVSKAILVLTHAPFFGGLEAELRVFDQKGNVVLQETEMLNAGLISAMVKKAQDAASGKTIPEPAKKETPIEYSEDSKQVQKIILRPTESAADSMMLKLPSELKKKLFHPEMFDPLSFMASDTYLSVAKHEGRQLVADLPDKSFGAGSALGDLEDEAPSSIEQAETLLKTGEVVRGMDDGQFLMIRPAVPSESRRIRVDRESLAALLASIETKDVSGLDDICAFAIRNVPPQENPITRSIGGTFVPALMGFDFTSMGTDWNMYRLYGTLSPSQRGALAAGTPIPFANMDSTQQGYMAALAFGSNSHPTADTGDDKPQDFFTMAMSMSGMGAVTDYREEPTEVMPSGLPAEGFLSAKEIAEPVFKPEKSDGSSSYMTLAPQLLGLIQCMKDGPMGAQAGSAFDLPQTGKIGQQLKMTFKFHLAKGVSITQRLADVNVPKDAQIVNMKQLPADFQALINAEAESFKKSPFAAMAAMGGMKSSAPPP